MSSRRGVGVDINAQTTVNINVGGSAGAAPVPARAGGSAVAPTQRGTGFGQVAAVGGVTTDFTRGVGGVRTALAGLRGNFLGVFFSGLFYQMSLQRVADAQDRLNKATEEFGADSDQAVAAQKDLAQANALLRIQMIQMNVQMLLIIADMATYTFQAIAATRATVGLSTAMKLVRFGPPLALAIGGGLGLLALMAFFQSPAASGNVGSATATTAAPQQLPSTSRGVLPQAPPAELAPAPRLGLSDLVSVRPQPELLRSDLQPELLRLASPVGPQSPMQVNERVTEKSVIERGMNIESVVVNVKDGKEGARFMAELSASSRGGI